MTDSLFKMAVTASVFLHIGVLFLAEAETIFGKRRPLIAPDSYTVSLVSPPKLEVEKPQKPEAASAPKPEPKISAIEKTAAINTPKPKTSPKPPAAPPKAATRPGTPSSADKALSADRQYAEGYVDYLRGLESAKKSMGQASGDIIPQSGGAGAAGAARLSETQGPIRIAEYGADFQLAIEDNFRYPSFDNKIYETVALVSFDGEGNITYKIEKDSGNIVFDRYAERAIQLADPFKPPPRPGLKFRLRISNDDKKVELLK